jgi:hypothetical protein
MMTASNVAINLRDLLDDAVISSREDNSMTSNIAINAPPIPIPIAVVSVTALDETAVDVTNKLITITNGDSLFNLSINRVEPDNVNWLAYKQYFA